MGWTAGKGLSLGLDDYEMMTTKEQSTNYDQNQVQGGIGQLQGYTGQQQGGLADILMQGITALNPQLFATGQNPTAPKAPGAAPVGTKQWSVIPNGSDTPSYVDSVTNTRYFPPGTVRQPSGGFNKEGLYQGSKSINGQYPMTTTPPPGAQAFNPNAQTANSIQQAQNYQNQVAQYQQQQQQYQQQMQQGPASNSAMGMINQGNQLIQQSTAGRMGALQQAPGFTPIAPSKNQDFTLNQGNNPSALNLGKGPGEMGFNQQAPSILNLGQQNPGNLQLNQQAPNNLNLQNVNTQFTDPSQQNVASLNLNPNRTGPLQLNGVNSQFTPLSGIDAMQYGNVDTSQYSPFIKNGQQASDQLASLSGIGANPLNSQQIYDKYLNNPAVQAQMQQGNQAINNSYSAKQMLGSGGLLKALNSYGQGVAAQTLGAEKSNLFNQSQLGANAANQYTGNLLSKYGTDMNAQAANQANQVGQQRNQVDWMTNQAGAQNNANANIISGYNAQNNASDQIQKNQIGAYNANQNALNANGALNLDYQRSQASAGLQGQANQTNAYTAQNNAQNQYSQNQINAYGEQNKAQNAYGANQINAYGAQTNAQNQYGQNQINAYNGQASAQNAYGANQVAGYKAQGDYSNNMQQNQINAYSANQAVQAQQQGLQLQYQQYANQASLLGQQNQISAYSAEQNAQAQARANQSSIFGQQAGMFNAMSNNNSTYAGLLSSLANNTGQLSAAAIKQIGDLLAGHIDSTVTTREPFAESGQGPAKLQ